MPTKKNRHGGGGVDHVAEAKKLPAISPIVVDAVTDLLMTEQGMKRPPEKAAALLALICELHKQGKPFPARETVAKKLDCSVFTVDAAISTRIDEGYLSMAIETTTGNVAQRHSTVRRRYYLPSKRLADVADRARRRG